MKKYHLSFCTTCMNRLSHLKETLVKNILDNQGYGDIEFVLLDYNSSDGLEDYVKTELNQFIVDGKLKYFRTEEPLKYNWSHSRNMVCRLASGDILCTVDADNFLGKGYAQFVNERFQKDENIFLSTISETPVKNDVLGRICVRKEHFLAVGGYDERMKHYGFEDYDFVNRLQNHGVKKQILNDPELLKTIRHTNAERMENGVKANELSSLLIGHLTPAASVLIFLFKDGSSCSGTMVNNRNYNALKSPYTEKKNLKYRYSIAENSWVYGTWTRKKNSISVLSGEKTSNLKLEKNKTDWNLEGITYFETSDSKIKEELVFFLHQLSNRQILEENTERRISKVNDDGYGKGNTRQNFSTVLITNS